MHLFFRGEVGEVAHVDGFGVDRSLEILERISTICSPNEVFRRPVKSVCGMLVVFFDEIHCEDEEWNVVLESLFGFWQFLMRAGKFSLIY